MVVGLPNIGKQYINYMKENKGKLIEVMLNGNYRVIKRFRQIHKFEKWMRVDAEEGVYNIFLVKKNKVKFEVTLHKETYKLWLADSPDPAVTLAVRYYNHLLFVGLANTRFRRIINR